MRKYPFYIFTLLQTSGPNGDGSFVADVIDDDVIMEEEEGVVDDDDEFVDDSNAHGYNLRTKSPVRKNQLVSAQKRPRSSSLPEEFPYCAVCKRTRGKVLKCCD